ncbi:MAG: tyrosine-type recombinase/integrase, partial [Oscillospiraceae bacterium]|nr:tyrosine-type recombinase/integrase [Oscillospiraceae bacterium]
QSLERRIHAELTILEYASDLRLFFRYLAQRRGLLPPDADWDEIDLSALVDVAFIRRVTAAEASDFISYCRNTRRNNPNTLSRRFIAVKRFFRYLTVQRHILEVNPMDELDPQKTGKSLPVYLPLEDCLNLLQTVEHDFENQFRERDYCMLTLFLNCGMRLSELCGLNLVDIHKDDTLRIRGKGSKERTVYLNGACTAALRRYLPMRPQEGLKADDRDAVFISRNKRRINQRSVELMLEKYLKICGLEGKGYSIHKLRHTAATLMYQNNVDVLQLKEILGHENLSTTQIYTHVLDSQLRAAVEQNPLAKVKIDEPKTPEEAAHRDYLMSQIFPPEMLKRMKEEQEKPIYTPEEPKTPEELEEEAAQREFLISHVLPPEMQEIAWASIRAQEGKR